MAYSLLEKAYAKSVTLQAYLVIRCSAVK